MISKRTWQVASATAIAIFMMAADANASSITYSTNAAGTEFVSPITGLTLDSSSGLSATLTFQPDANITTGTPSNINFGIFTLTCNACLTDETDSAVFNAFTFDLVITDQTDGATGDFVGTSTGGNVGFNTSTITINWAPPQIGPGGDFKQTDFVINSTSRIVAPNSGANIGATTIQGGINTVPEPATIGLIGAGLIGLGLLRRRTRTASK
jgi:hypothetical protein